MDRNQLHPLEKVNSMVNLEVRFDRSRLDIRKHSFSKRIINSWNSLPSSVVNAKTVNGFKNAYDRKDMDIRSR